MPVVMPVTMPAPVMVARVLEALQVPPATLADRVIDALTQTAPAPDRVPATGSGFTVTKVSAVAVPQPLVTA